MYCRRLVYHPELASHYFAYDMWSIAVLWLEFIFGTPHVFELPTKTQKLVKRDLQTFNMKDEDIETAFLLRSMMEFCIYPPRSFMDPGRYPAATGRRYSSSLMVQREIEWPKCLWIREICR